VEVGGSNPPIPTTVASRHSLGPSTSVSGLVPNRYFFGMNLQQLRYLVGVADHGTMTRAAAAIPVAQPVLTRAVRKLEGELGVALFDRHGRGVVLTAMGVAVADRARAVLAGVDDIAGFATASELSAQPLSIATGSSIEEVLAARITTIAASLVPPLHVSFVSTVDSLATAEAVRSKRVQLGIVEGSAPADLRATGIMMLEAGLMCPEHHGLPNPIPVNMLEDVALIAPHRGTPRRARIDAALDVLGVHPHVVVETGDRTSWPSLVRAGHGFALAYIDTRQPPPTGTVLIPFIPPIVSELSAITRPDEPGRAVAEIIARLVV
jgi:DNA-binding transcriptional LysR family regulator